MSGFRLLHFRKDIHKLEQVQQKTTQVARRLKLKELGLFSLQERRLWEDQTALPLP